MGKVCCKWPVFCSSEKKAWKNLARNRKIIMQKFGVREEGRECFRIKRGLVKIARLYEPIQVSGSLGPKWVFTNKRRFRAIDRRLAKKNDFLFKWKKYFGLIKLIKVKFL